MAKKILNIELLNQNINKVLSAPADNTLQSTNSIGLSNVVKYVWNHYSTSLVDFDSFTLNDLYNAKSQFYDLPTNEEGYEDDNDASFVEVDENGQPIERTVNCWQENYAVESIIASLYHAKNIVYENNDDDFI